LFGEVEGGGVGSAFGIGAALDIIYYHTDMYITFETKEKRKRTLLRELAVSILALHQVDLTAQELSESRFLAAHLCYRLKTLKEQENGGKKEGN